jgi:hypothetical protein
MAGDEIQGDEPIRPNFDDMLYENQEMPAGIFSPNNMISPTAGAYEDEPLPPTIPMESSTATNLISPTPPTIDEQSSHPSHSLAIAPSQRSQNKPDNRYNKSFKDSEVPSDDDNDADDERFKD